MFARRSRRRASPTGPAGTSGTLHAYDAQNTNTVSDSEKAIVGLSDLPAGSYVVTVTLSNDGSGEGNDAFCSLDKNGVPQGNAVNGSRIQSEGSLAFTALVPTSGSDTIAADCVSTGALIHGQMVAIKVDEVN